MFWLAQAISTKPLRLIIGADGTEQCGWIATNRADLDLLQPPAWAALFDTRPIDALLAEHVWEHLSAEEASQAARTCFRYLAPGGYLRLAVPDGFHPDPGYIAWVRPGGIGPGAPDHKVLYDYRSLSRLLEEAGFTVRILEHFDEAGAFHFQDWDPQDGFIYRSSRFDHRNTRTALRYTSIVADAVKSG